MQPKITPVFRKNSQAWLSGYNLIINQGGQGSSKTHSILDLFYILASNFEERKIFTICSYALPHLKMGPIRDFENILLSYGIQPDKVHNKSDHYFRIGESIIDYFGIRDNYSKVTGPRRDFLFINECNNKIEYNDYDQLNQRTHDCTFLDFNPRSEFWVHDKVIPHFNHAFIKSTFLDNPYLPETERNKILWKKDKPEFENWWKVYGLGELGKFDGVIFPNWDHGEFNPDGLSEMFGLDFGFHPDPDSMVKVAIDEKRKIIYAKECFYQSGQLPAQLADNISRYALRNDLIVADSADPRMIASLKTKFNIRGVKKTGTVAEWIRLMQDYKFIIDPESYNTTKEFNNYTWNDKKAGIPIDSFNHQIDPIRYVYMSKNTMRAKTKAY